MERFPAIRYPGNVPGILYEPRALWSLEKVDTEQIANGRITFPRNDFLNASKYPIVLTQLLFSPVNYIYREGGAGPGTTLQDYQVDGGSVLNVASILINAPQRQNYSRRVIPLTSFPAQPRWLPTMRGVYRGQVGNENDYPSSIWGVTRWDFDHPMIMSRLSTMELGLSGFNNSMNVVDPLNLREVRFAVAVNEGPPAGSSAPGTLNNFPGNARVQPPTPLRYNAGFSPLRTSGQGGLGNPLASQQQQVFTKAFPPQTYGSPFETNQQWPPDQQLSARDYDRQNPNASGSSPVTGFAVHIDQLDYDDVTVNQFGQLQPNTPISPLAMRVAARARTRNGGTGEWWWRPGAPLALVCPTITPALVYKFPQPITLAPGDTLDVELQTERANVVAGVEQQYNVGLSFCGFAAIEG